MIDQLGQRPVRVKHRDLLQLLQLVGKQLQPPGRRSLAFVELVEPVVQVAECDQRGAAEHPAADQQDVLPVGTTLEHHDEDGQTQAEQADDHGHEALAQRESDEYQGEQVQPGDGIPGNDHVENECGDDADGCQRDRGGPMPTQPDHTTEDPPKAALFFAR